MDKKYGNNERTTRDIIERAHEPHRKQTNRRTKRTARRRQHIPAPPAPKEEELGFARSRTRRGIAISPRPPPQSRSPKSSLGVPEPGNVSGTKQFVAKKYEHYDNLKNPESKSRHTRTRSIREERALRMQTMRRRRNREEDDKAGSSQQTTNGAANEDSDDHSGKRSALSSLFKSVFGKKRANSPPRNGDQKDDHHGHDSPDDEPELDVDDDSSSPSVSMNAREDDHQHMHSGSMTLSNKLASEDSPHESATSAAGNSSSVGGDDRDLPAVTPTATPSMSSPLSARSSSKPKVSSSNGSSARPVLTRTNSASAMLSSYPSGGFGTRGSPTGSRIRGALTTGGSSFRGDSRAFMSSRAQGSLASMTEVGSPTLSAGAMSGGGGAGTREVAARQKSLELKFDQVEKRMIAMAEENAFLRQQVEDMHRGIDLIQENMRSLADMPATLGKMKRRMDRYRREQKQYQGTVKQLRKDTKKRPKDKMIWMLVSWFLMGLTAVVSMLQYMFMAPIDYVATRMSSSSGAHQSSSSSSSSSNGRSRKRSVSSSIGGGSTTNTASVASSSPGVPRSETGARSRGRGGRGSEGTGRSGSVASNTSESRGGHGDHRHSYRSDRVH